MDRINLRLTEPVKAHRVILDLWSTSIKGALLMGQELTLEVREAKRSDAQNRILWSILSDMARQIEWHGQKLSAEEWKDAATASLKGQRVVPGIDHKGFIVLGQRTSRMTKAELSELLEFCYAFGAKHSVNWSRTSLGRDCPEE